MNWLAAVLLLAGHAAASFAIELLEAPSLLCHVIALAALGLAIWRWRRAALLLLLLCAPAHAAHYRLSADGSTLVWTRGEHPGPTELVRKRLDSGAEKTFPLPGLTGAPLVSPDGRTALVSTRERRLAVNLDNGSRSEEPHEPVSYGALTVYRLPGGKLSVEGKTLPYLDASADPERPWVLLAKGDSIAAWRQRILNRRAVEGAVILGPGLIARPGWSVEELGFPSLKGRVLWKGKGRPSSYAMTPEALYLITEDPRTIRKIYRDNAAEVWALPWTAKPTSLLGERGGELLVTDGEAYWSVPADPSKLHLYKDLVDAPAPVQKVGLLGAVLALALVGGLVWAVRELKGPARRRKAR